LPTITIIYYDNKGEKIMDLNKDNQQNKIAEIRAKKEEKKLEKAVILADKKIGWIVFWSLLLPIGSYIYTGRWKTFFIIFACQFSIGFGIAMTSEDPEEGFTNAFNWSLISWPIISLVDNISAVNRSRDQIKELS